MESSASRHIFWHRDLPPAHGQPAGEGFVVAASLRVRDTLAERSSMWESCLADLKQEAHRRIEQERVRLKADYVHVLYESTRTRHDPRTGEAWLQGTYGYVLLRASAPPPATAHSPTTQCGTEGDCHAH